MQNIIVKNNQNIFDLATQHNGSVEAAFALASLNEISVTKTSATATIIKPVALKNKSVIDFFDRSIVSPSSSDAIENAGGTGIGFMKIGSTFKVG